MIEFFLGAAFGATAFMGAFAIATRWHQSPVTAQAISAGALPFVVKNDEIDHRIEQQAYVSQYGQYKDVSPDGLEGLGR